MMTTGGVAAAALALADHVRTGGGASAWLTEHGIPPLDRARILLAFGDLDDVDIPTDAGQYVEPEAAARLIVGVVTGETEEHRERCRRALTALSLEVPLLPEREPLDELGAALGRVLVDGIARNTDRRDRQRLAGLLSSLLREAERLASRRVA